MWRSVGIRTLADGHASNAAVLIDSVARGTTGRASEPWPRSDARRVLPEWFGDLAIPLPHDVPQVAVARRGGNHLEARTVSPIT